MVCYWVLRKETPREKQMELTTATQKDLATERPRELQTDSATDRQKEQAKEPATVHQWDFLQRQMERPRARLMEQWE